LSQETCETKSIRPTRYLIVKDLGRSRRAEEEALTSFHPCQRLSAFFLKELSAPSQGRCPFPLRRGVLLTEAPTPRQLLSASSSGKDLAGRLGHSAFPCGEGRFYVNRCPSSTLFWNLFKKPSTTLPRAFRPFVAASGVSRGSEVESQQEYGGTIR